MDKYSVLMSVYVKEKPEYLQLSIESMLNQTVEPDEFIIVKDGSLTSELDNIIDYYRVKYENLFTVISLPTNGGLGNALNVGIEASRNELIARMDSDDISKPDRCEKQLGVFADNPDLAICGTLIDEFIDTVDNVVSTRIVPCTNSEIKKFARRRSPFNHPTVMYRKSVLKKLNGYQTSGRKEDLDLFLRLVNENYKAQNIGEALLYYRTNRDNLKRRKTWQNCSEYIEIMIGFYRKGYCSLVDLLYVIVGQIVMYITPAKITAILNKCFLRSEK